MPSLRGLAVAIGFLTRVPVRVDAVDDAAVGASMAWFPAVGLALGAVLAGAAGLMQDDVSPELAAVMLVATLALLSGGFHLDGFADVFDGVGGSRGDRARMLDIMRDSRIGAFGAIALVLLLLAKVFALRDVLGHGGAAALLVCPTIARWVLVPLILAFPYARPSGLGSPFRRHGRPAHLVAATAFALLVLALAGGAVVVPALAAVSAAFAFAAWIHIRLGGLTGDVYGAAVEVAELVFLVTCAMR